MLPDRTETQRLALRAFIATASAVFVVSVALLVWSALDVFLLLFAGLVLAVLLSGMSGLVKSRLGISYGWSLAGVVVVSLLIGGMVTWWLLPGISDQVDELRQKLPQALHKFQSLLESRQWSRAILEQSPTEPAMFVKRANILQRITGVFSTALGALTSALVVVFTGLFLAVDPGLYRRGIIHLVPLPRRARAQQVLDSVGDSLWWWLVAKFGSMLVVGILTGVGLWALNVPLAFSLAILAALLTFIPNIGPILSAIPAILLALLVSLPLALWVAILYIAIQTVESYLITPVFQQKALSLPPALVIAAQLFMGFFTGIVGLIVATPLTAVVFVLVKELYVKDALGDHDQ